MRQQGRVAIVIAQHQAADLQLRERGRQPGERRPALQKRVIDPIEAIEVVGRPNGVEMLCDNGEYLIEFLHDDRLSTTLRHADHRCIPTKLYVCHERAPSAWLPQSRDWA